ncbi:MFS transporter [Alicyclobacillus sp. SO9]|uniref:MFS transporter n=1 Tax=Alicyclobacillus sp. SO9 TaxID=2665646 RepID=UPI0018E86AA9|nr:MFS transporter [Alicyclobacillus sp. SO9]QQE79297.1 MFS transporter [Alicyclobacillus sp. SO9]
MNGFARSVQTSDKYKWFVLLLTTFTQMSIAFVGQGVGAIAPFLQSHFHLNHAQVGFAVSANNFGIGLTALFFGKLVDRFGEKKMMVLGGVMTGLSIFVASLSTGYWMLLFLLVETGLWSGSATPAGSKAIFNYFPASSRGTAMGIRQMGISAGAFLAALVLPVVTKAVTWNAAFDLAGTVAILANILYLLMYRQKQTIRSVNTVRGTETGKSKKSSLLHNTAIWYTSLAGTTFIGAQFAIISYSQLFLHSQAGMSYHYTFYFLAAAQLAGMIGRVLWGTVSDAFFSSKRKPILFFIGVMLAGLSLSMLTISVKTPIWMLILMFVLLGLAAMGWNGLWVTLVSELVDSSQSSSAVGTAVSILQLGVLIFPVIFGYIVDSTGSYSISWVFIACCVTAGLILLARVKESSGESSV